MPEIVIIADYGGPENTGAVKPFLKNMFRDKRILSVPSWVRYPLAFLISSLRAKKSQGIYASIGGSPVTTHVKNICDRLNALQNKKIFVPGYRYMSPYIQEVIELQKNAESIHVFPTFPHYSFSTYQTIMDVTEKYSRVTVETPYFSDTGFNRLLIESISNSMKEMAEMPAIMLTAHSVPVSFVKKGDPYISQVTEQFQILKSAFHNTTVKLCYQSPLGPVEWVGPFIEETVDSLAEAGFKNLIVVPLSFTVDNSETRYELDDYLKEYALEKGFTDYKRVTCLNDSEPFCRFILERTGCN